MSRADEIERAAFEAWAAEEYATSRPPDAAWIGWQARAARPPDGGEVKLETDKPVAYRVKLGDRWHYAEEQNDTWWDHIVEKLFLHPDPRVRVLREALTQVREIIKEGAMEGFNPMAGTWAERLFASQAMTRAALATGEQDA